MIEETIYGVCPSKSNCYRFSGKIVYKTKALKEYEKKFFIQCRSRNTNITGYFKFEINVFYPNERADLDNSLKVVLDCLQASVVIKNDNKCVEITARKFMDKKNPRVELKLIPVDNG